MQQIANSTTTLQTLFIWLSSPRRLSTKTTAKSPKITPVTAKLADAAPDAVVSFFETNESPIPHDSRAQSTVHLFLISSFSLRNTTICRRCHLFLFDTDRLSRSNVALSNLMYSHRRRLYGNVSVYTNMAFLFSSWDDQWSLGRRYGYSAAYCSLLVADRSRRFVHFRFSLLCLVPCRLVFGFCHLRAFVPCIITYTTPCYYC